MKLHIGLDSTDSPSGGCTTFTGSLLIDALNNQLDKLNFIDFPRLIRLNPNIPHKTRGNAAIAFTINTDYKIDDISSILTPIVERETELYGNGQSKSGLIIVEDKSRTKFLTNLNYFKALQKVIEYGSLNLEHVAFKYPETSIGHIGALSAIYADLSDDFTYELLTYRFPDMYGKKRTMELSNIISLSTLYPTAFSCYDNTKKRELIAPSGPDPIYYGLRGECVSDLLEFSDRLLKNEKISSWTIFKTNQGTNAHVNKPNANVQAYNSISTTAQVVSFPVELQGGHIKFKFHIDSQPIDCMIFEPTKQLRNVARSLIPGDQIYIHANARNDKHGLHLALEYMTIISIVTYKIKSAPICECSHRMTKLGTFKGFKCRECGNKTQKPIITIIPRKIFIGQRVYASKSAQRHLTRPLQRLHIKNKTIQKPKIFQYNEFRKILTKNVF